MLLCKGNTSHALQARDIHALHLLPQGSSQQPLKACCLRCFANSFCQAHLRLVEAASKHRMKLPAC